MIQIDEELIFAVLSVTKFQCQYFIRDPRSSVSIHAQTFPPLQIRNDLILERSLITIY